MLALEKKTIINKYKKTSNNSTQTEQNNSCLANVWR